MQLNEILFAGRAGSDAKIQKTSTGKEQVRFSLAHNRKGENGYPDVTTWVSVDVYGGWCRTARNVAKGDEVVVRGSLQVRQYQDTKTSLEKTYVGILASQIGITQYHSKGEAVDASSRDFPPNDVAKKEEGTVPWPNTQLTSDELDQIPF